MNNFKLTSSTLCAIIIIVAFFMTWAGQGVQSASGWDMWQLGISPGFASGMVSGFSRIYLLLLIAVPASAALFIWQKSTAEPNAKLTVWAKRAYFIPAVITILGFVIGWMKLRSTYNDMAEQMEGLGELGGMMSSMMPKIELPGLTDLLGIGAYLTLAASIYLLVIGLGKVQDKLLWENKPSVTINQ